LCFVLGISGSARAFLFCLGHFYFFLDTSRSTWAFLFCLGHF
jgi:hypothetical protein